MKATHIGLVVVITAALQSGLVAQQMPSGPVQLAGGPRPTFVDPAVVYASCDACDAYGNSIGGGAACPPGYGGGAGGGPGSGYGAGWGASGGWDQCGPHYHDISADALYWRRDRTADPPVPFASQGVNGPRVLTTSDTKFDLEPGFRMTGRFDTGPISFIEATYFGTFFWSSTAEVTSDDDDLFSPFSDFGLDPFLGIGFSDTDQANLASLKYQAKLNNGEINYRWYWVADHPGITGTVLMGARYLRLTEQLLYHTETDFGQMDYTVGTENDLVGFQIGGDAAICLLQGLRAVGAAKIGIYNNRSKQRTLIVATSLASDIYEEVKDNTNAFVGEGEISLVADLLPSFSLRGGYQMLWVNSVALAGNNFNDMPPPFTGGPNQRIPFLDDESSAFYHGVFVGLEYVR